MRFLLIPTLTLSLFCPDAFAWRCCTPDGKDAPGIHLTQSKCESQGLVPDPGLLCPLTSGALSRARSNPEAAFLTFLNSRYNRLSPNVTMAAKCILHQRRNAEQNARDFLNRNRSSIETPDKFLHCALSASLKISCGHAPAEIAGHVREIYQLFDSSPGNSFGSGDQTANNKGRQFASGSRNNEHAFIACAREY